MNKIFEAIITGIIAIIVLKLSQKGYIFYYISEWIGVVLHLSVQEVGQKVSAAIIAIFSTVFISFTNRIVPSFKVEFYNEINEKIVNLKAIGSKTNYKTEEFKIKIQVKNNIVSNIILKWLNAVITIIITPDTYTLTENDNFINQEDKITRKINHGYKIPIQHFPPSNSEVSVEIPFIAMSMYQGAGRIEVSIKGKNKLENCFLHVYCKMEKSNFELRSISNE